jgi:hypothetical protein
LIAVLVSGRPQKMQRVRFWDGAFKALQMLDSHLAMRHRARLLANCGAPISQTRGVNVAAMIH